MLACVLLSLVQAWVNLERAEPALLASAMGPLAIVALVELTPWWSARQSFRTNATLRGDIVGAVTDEGVEWRSSLGESRLSWSALHGARATPDLLIIFVDARQAYPIPRELVESDDAWSRLRALVAERLPAR